MKKFKNVLLLLFVSYGLFACGGSSSSQLSHQSGRLIRADLLKTYSSIAINQTFDEVEGLSASYSVKVYRLTYETKNPDGEFIHASGIISVPEKGANAKSPLLAYHHGTIYQSRNAPSQRVFPGAPWVAPAALGFITVAPDYIGFAESQGTLHPYLHAKTLASSSVDLLRASTTWLKESHIKTNSQLFLGGYSQGGMATMATHKAIETLFANEFSVTLSSPGDGAYTLSDQFLGDAAKMLDNYETGSLIRPENIAFILKTMNDVYGLNKLSEMFQPKYVSVVNSLYDGSHSGAYIRSKLSNKLSELLNRDFLQSIQDGKEEKLLNAFQENDLYDWKPVAPIIIYHGRDDAWLPFSHAQKSKDTMTANGATDVSIIECVPFSADQASNHANCYEPYLVHAAQLFLQYADDL